MYPLKKNCFIFKTECFPGPGICPEYESAECPDEMVNFCTAGDDSECPDGYKCCFTGCEFDCLGELLSRHIIIIIIIPLL